MFVIMNIQIWYYYTKTASKAIQNGRHMFKMAATELRIGQNSPMHTLKLTFEAVVLTDCMFLAYNEKRGIQVLIPDESIKIEDGRQKI